MVLGHIAQAAVGVARGGAYFERVLTESDDVTMGEFNIDIGGADLLGNGNLATRLLLHQPGAGDVIGMTVSIHRVEQFQVQFAKQGQVTIHLLEHRVDDHGLPGVLIREYVGICRGGGIKQLLEDHGSQGSWWLVK